MNTFPSRKLMGTGTGFLPVSVLVVPFHERSIPTHSPVRQYIPSATDVVKLNTLNEGHLWTERKLPS